jgi:hypothetical protein
LIERLRRNVHEPRYLPLSVPFCPLRQGQTRVSVLLAPEMATKPDDTEKRRRRVGLVPYSRQSIRQIVRPRSRAWTFSAGSRRRPCRRR